MIIFYLLIISFVIFVIGLIILFFLIWSLCVNYITRVPWARIPESNIEIILNEFNLPENSLVYDLGCGDGRFLFAAEKRGYRPVGYEMSLYPYLKASVRKILLNSSMKIKLKNFLHDNIKEADMVFMFLVERVMAKTENKLKRELRKGTPVISYGFELPGLLPKKVINTQPSKTYIYKI